jgi:hypothetical protein
VKLYGQLQQTAPNTALPVVLVADTGASFAFDVQPIFHQPAAQHQMHKLFHYRSSV